ncbi:MAG: hypothetical protein U0836_12850 [Pirellulales bacterium]
MNTRHDSAAATSTSALPAGLLVGVLVAILFLSLFALEISHGYFRENGQVAKSLFFFPPTVLLIWGMLKRRRWALLAARCAALLGSGWFYLWAVIAVVGQYQDEHGPVWIWLMGVSAILGSVLLAAFFGLGRATVAKHYGLVCPLCGQRISGLKAYFARQPRCRACAKGEET